MFTVVIPCFNDVEFLNKTIAGLAAQVDAPPYEAVLVDNNSDREDVNAVYRQWVGKVDIFLVKQPKLATTFSLCRARNVGLQIAQHPWVVGLDSDCIPNPHFLATLALAAAAEPNGIFTGERVFVDASHVHADEIAQRSVNLTSLPRVQSTSNYGRVIDRRLPYLDHLDSSPQPWSYFHGGNTAYQRHQAVLLGGFNTDYDGHWGYEDVEFAHRMIALGGSVPQFIRGLEVYHQEPEVAPRQPERLDKRRNPNWHLICRAIPGFREYKEHQYRSFAEVRV